MFSFPASSARSLRARSTAWSTAALPALLFLIFFSISNREARADDLLDDSQVWGAVTATGSLRPLGDHWRFWLEGQGRFGNDMSTLSQGIIRPGVGYALNEHASLWLGYAYIHTDTPFVRTNFDENRIWQQFLWNQALGAGSLTMRSRLEQRFFDNISDDGWRFRQLFKVSYPIKGIPNVSAVASDEVFINLNDVGRGPQAGLDQNRAFAGLGYAFNKTVKTEVGYLNQFIDRPINPNRMTHALAINLFLSFP